ncbi:divalent-cation tolerance protein CutA [uncultured Sphingomonas sp.]|uniref:divalent-cation tolerance protein CutA n=1 Tax=uncultured Sphingomonas sp. TaxID=158754 RepID=UPI0025E8B5D1|nr:divalent-cation tolerance protein CutA [uncultured Sphingomonas sp.]
MATIALVHVTFADAAEAERIGSTMVAERLAACVTIHPPCRSIYRWDGKMERGQEIPATFKTAGIRAGRLRAAILRLHSYELPVIETTAAEVDASVADWVDEATH